MTIQHNPSNKDEVYEQFLKLLTTLSSKNLAERLLVLRILKFIIYLDKLDSSLTPLLMGLYSEGDSEIQTLLLEYFKHKGVEDPYHYFPREIESTLTSSLTVSLGDMITKSTEWLDMWAEDYLRKQGVKISKKGTTRKSTSRTNSRRSISLPSYDPIEVINYFVRTEHEKELAKYDIMNTPTLITFLYVDVNQLRLLHHLLNQKMIFLVMLWFLSLVWIIVVT